MRRFWAKVRVGDPTVCWEWTASRFEGYGRFTLGGKVRKAHRVAWVLTNGPIPEGGQVLHRCDNPPCVNPAHLFLGTHSDNMKDAWRKGRARGLKTGSLPRTHCPKAHPYDEANTGYNSAGHRMCRICTKEYRRVWEKAKRDARGEA